MKGKPMSKVYIIQNSYMRDSESGSLRPRFNLGPVKEFGEPVEILDGRLSPMATAPAMNALRHALRNYSDEDYLLAIGAPSFLIAAGMIAGNFNNGRVHMLHWEKALQRYYPLTFDINAKGA